MRLILSAVLLAFSIQAFAQTPPLIRLGRGFAAEEQVWLMSARPDLTPNQGKRYQLKQILFQANPERFQAYLAGELDAGTAPGMALIPARAQGMCQPDETCRFKKPNVLFVIDYSSSMVGFAQSPAYFPPGQTATTRWDAQLDAISFMLGHDGGFFANNLRLGLARFAHDPVLATPGTVLQNDVSFPPITDGFALDVPFDGQDGDYLECRRMIEIAGAGLAAGRATGEQVARLEERLEACCGAVGHAHVVLPLRRPGTLFSCRELCMLLCSRASGVSCPAPRRA